MCNQGMPQQPHQYCLWVMPTDCSVGDSNICRIEYWSWAYKKLKILTLLKKSWEDCLNLICPSDIPPSTFHFSPHFSMWYPVQWTKSADRGKQKLNFMTLPTNIFFYVLIYKCLVCFYSNVPHNPSTRLLAFTFVLASIMKRRRETDNAY